MLQSKLHWPVKILPTNLSGTVHLLARHGRSLIHIDPKVESTLRLKLDLCIIPTVSMLYLFCFIDRANIGEEKEK